MRSRLLQPGRLAALWLLAFLCPLPVQAWNATGHRLTAAIAWEEMTPAARTQVTELLLLHPEAKIWETRWREYYPGILFAEAASWADELRQQAKLSGMADDAAHRDWHYLDWPLGVPRNQARRGQLLTQLERQAGIVANAEASPEDRAVALAWLIHLTGDAHQPLHNATWRIGDRWSDGGNGYVVIDPANARMPETNLHRFWDDLPGPPWVRGRRLHERVSLLRQWLPSTQVTQGTPVDWIEESHSLAASQVLPESPPPFTITPDYRKRSEELADRRIAEAGIRLGRWMNRLLGQVKR